LRRTEDTESVMETGNHCWVLFSLYIYNAL